MPLEDAFKKSFRYHLYLTFQFTGICKESILDEKFEQDDIYVKFMRSDRPIARQRRKILKNGPEDKFYREYINDAYKTHLKNNIIKDKGDKKDIKQIYNRLKQIHDRIKYSFLLHSIPYEVRENMLNHFDEVLYDDYMNGTLNMYYMMVIYIRGLEADLYMLTRIYKYMFATRDLKSDKAI